MRRGVAVALAVLALAGACATTEQWAYDKKGATPARLDQDLSACRQESKDPRTFGLTLEQRLDRERFKRCMERKGYSVTRVE